jgi:CRP-like cAMP-binding protein
LSLESYVSITAHFVGPHERLLLLKAMSLAGHPPVAALKALAQQAVERHLDAGAQVTDINRSWDSAFIVVEGRVNLYQDGQLLYAAGPTEVFGLVEVLARVGAGVVEARADLDTLALEIPATTLLSILDDHPVMTLDTIQALGRILLTTPSWLLSTTERTVPASGIVEPKGLELVNRIRQLQTNDVFAHARVDSLAEIASQYTEFHALEGKALWREGDPADWLLVLRDGRVDGRSSGGLHFSWTAGMVMGAFDALAAAPRWHDAIAATDVTGFRLSTERLYDALEDDFVMAADLLSTLASRVRAQRLALRTRIT